MDKIGRKKTILLTQMPAILGWLIIAFATNVPMIYAGRLLTGLGSGMVAAPSRVYTSEITQPHLRGMLSALSAVAISVGVLFQYTIGSFTSWPVLAGISSIVPILAFLSMLLLPETPNYLISKLKEEQASKSLAKLRGSNYNVQREMDTLKKFAYKLRENAQQ